MSHIGGERIAGVSISVGRCCLNCVLGQSGESFPHQ